MSRNWVEELLAALNRFAASDFPGAESICQGLLDAEPANHAAQLLLGLAVAAQGDIPKAQACLVAVAHARADGGHRPYELGGTLVRLHCRPLVAALYRESVSRAPDDSRLRYCFAEFLHEAHELHEAKEVLLEGLRGNPRWPAAHQLLGIVEADLGHFGAAIARFRRVTSIVPENPGGWANLGAMLKIEGKFGSALKAYDRAVTLAPQDARIRVNRCVALLHAGRLREAWPDFEYRLELPEHQAMRVDWPIPLLKQLRDADGQTVLVTHSDGFGDTLQFMRYLPLLARHCARVVAWVPKPLERVLQSVESVAAVQSGDQPTPDCDYYCPFVSLPRVFNTSVETIPNNVPYLEADGALKRRWQGRLPDGGLLVGLVWAGQVRPHLPGFDVLDARRSTKLATLAELARVTGARFVSLQMGPAADQLREAPPGLEVFDPMGEVADFADTAAIIANLDVVVSVDTSVVHLAGAMGKPVLLLDRYDNCWRWLSGRMDSPWYPSLRIFRQKRLDEWEPVIGRVAAALNAAVASRPSREPQRLSAA